MDPDRPPGTIRMQFRKTKKPEKTVIFGYYGPVSMMQTMPQWNGEWSPFAGRRPALGHGVPGRRPALACTGGTECRAAGRRPALAGSPGGWVEFQEGGRIRNPPSAGDFVVNATELRAIAFSMQPLDRQLPLSEVTVRKSGRLAAIVSVPPGPLPKRYSLDVTNDNEIRAKCW